MTDPVFDFKPDHTAPFLVTINFVAQQHKARIGTW